MPRRPFAQALALAVVLPAIALPSTASAATITGSDRGERLLGTSGADAIAALGGRDLVLGRAGADTLDGGAGRDVVRGGWGDDAVRGGPGRDRVLANKGVDTVEGGAGDDDLWALSRKDVSGPGDAIGDTLIGGAGDDRFHVFDGEADRISCGDGRDRVKADVHDVIADATPANPNGSCERVTRSQPESDALDDQV